MPVTINKRKHTGALVCDVCGVRSEPYRYSSPAAPELTTCEAAEADGWTYTVGFFAMVTGPQCVCPPCSAKRRAAPPQPRPAPDGYGLRLRFTYGGRSLGPAYRSTGVHLRSYDDTPANRTYAYRLSRRWIRWCRHASTDATVKVQRSGLSSVAGFIWSSDGSYDAVLLDLVTDSKGETSDD